MLQKVIDRVRTGKARHTAYVFGGMANGFAGKRQPGLAMFGKGIIGLERAWRESHPDFEGGPVDRWREAIRFYEQTHQSAGKRWLHIVGIPMIVGGTAGLLMNDERDGKWAVSAGFFSVGWALNFVGHGVFERNAPAFADDPLAFIAGPVWDLMQLGGIAKRNGASAAAA